MSYSMYINVKDGKAEVDSANYVAPPDGKYMISGHVPTGEPGNWDQETITVTRFAAGGTWADQVAQATATIKRAAVK